MRVAYVCVDPGVPVFGKKGCTVHVQEIVRAFRKRGADVTLFARRLDGAPPYDLHDLKVRRLPSLPKGDPVAREQELLLQNGALEDLLEEAGRFDLVYERHALWSYAAMAYAMRKGIPGVLEVNAPLVEEQLRHRGLHDREGAEAVTKRVFSLARTVVAVSEPVAAYVRRYGVPRRRVVVVPNGVRPELFGRSRRARVVEDDDDFVIGFVGTLKPWHGLDTLAAAFSRLRELAPGVRLLLVGDGPGREAFAERLDTLGVLASTCFVGSVLPDEVPAHLADMDVAVAPYPEAEEFYFSPLKVYEYLAAGLPVVAGRIGELASLIRDGENGLLVPPGDAGAMAEALDRLRRDPQLRARLGAAARETVRQGHTWDAALERILAAAGMRNPNPARSPAGSASSF